nr:glycosyltransferase [Patescibacteria group bacterium]
MDPKVSIIIVTYNSARWLGDDIQTVFEQDYSNYEVIVVDNASSDDTVTIIEKKYPNAILIKNDINAGFGVANNIGVAHANGELIFFL